MNSSKRVLANTIILYGKIIITMLISLVSVPMILHALGKSDYGIYNLVAGIVAMLSFLNASMTITTQRYLSIAIGEGDNAKLNYIYNTSFILHITIGLIVVLLFELCFVFLFNGFLNIPSERIHAAKVVYQFIVVSTFGTIISVPFSAVMNAKENMMAFSIIAIIDSLLRLLLAFYLEACPFDRLIVYGVGMALLSLMNVIVYFFYVRYKYRELTISIRGYFRKTLFTEMFGFAGWNTLASFSMLGRNQGIAVLINLFCGTVANAAYGIANQINGMLSYFSSTFQKALNPQLMQSEGMQDRSRLIRISLISSKYSVWVVALFAIPLIIEMPFVLELWLKVVPEYTLRLSQLILFLSIVYQCSAGLMSAVQAVGKIRNYQLVMSLLILLNLPICYFLLKMGLQVHYCIVVFIFIEIVSLIARLFMAKKLVGIKVMAYIKTVIVPNVLCIIVGTIIALFLHYSMNESLGRLLLVCFAYLLGYLAVAWFFVFDSEVKDVIVATANKVLHH